jgi:hypothetical protein
LKIEGWAATRLRYQAGTGVGEIGEWARGNGDRLVEGADGRGTGSACTGTVASTDNFSTLILVMRQWIVCPGQKRSSGVFTSGSEKHLIGRNPESPFFKRMCTPIACPLQDPASK